MASKKAKKDAFVSREEYETLQSEFLACQRKLQSKDEAIRILRGELELCQEEKSDCIQQMNQIKNFLMHEHKSSSSVLFSDEEEADSEDKDKRVIHLESHVAQLKQRHKEEIQSLREKLTHARNALSSSTSVTTSELAEERSLLISQLETVQAKIGELQREVQSLEDEKEDLLSERDYFAGKCSSLNKCLEEKDNSKPPSLNTLEHLLEDNRKLKVNLVECEAERDSALNKIERYKRAVERRKTKESQDEALQSMTPTKLADLRKSVKRVQELDSLANSLSEELKEKSLALTHQRKTNKLLGTRIAELEHRLKVLEISGLWATHPSSDHTPSLPFHKTSVSLDNNSSLENGEHKGVEQLASDDFTPSNTATELSNENS